jgi:hypothetical protein
MSSLVGYINVASNNGDSFINASNNDFLIFPQSNTQNILLGVNQNSLPSILISSNQTTINGNVNFTGTFGLNTNLTIDSNNLTVLNNTVGWSPITSTTSYFSSFENVVSGVNNDLYNVILDPNYNIYLSSSYTTNSPIIYNCNNISSGLTLPNNTSNNSFIVKYNSNGTTAWTTSIIGTLSNTALTVDSSSNVILCGAYSIPPTIYDTGNTVSGLTTLPTTSGTAVFIVKYNSAGTSTWTTAINNTHVRDIITDTSNNIYACGTCTATPIVYDGTYTPSTNATFPTLTAHSSYLVKYNSNGVSQWAVSVNNTSPTNFPTAITTDINQNVFLVGKYNSNSSSIYQNQTLAFTTTLSSNNAVYALKINSNGVPLWTVSVNSAGNNSCLDCCSDQGGNLYIASTYETIAAIFNSNGTNPYTLSNPINPSGYLVKYNSNGVYQWATTIQSSTGSNLNYSVTTDNNYNVYVAGSYIGSPNIYNSSNILSPITLTTANYNASFVLKYDSNGSILNSLDILGSNNSAHSIAVDTFGSNIVIAGFTTGSNTIFNANSTASTNTFPSGIGLSAYISSYNLLSTPFYLISSLGNSNNGQQKYITNIGSSNLTLNVTNSNNTSILNTYTIPPLSNALFNWYNGSWYKVI